MKAILCLMTVLLFSHVSYGINSYEEYEDGDESSNSDKEIVTSSYILPKQIFNDGKPFYLEKDPVSGILDFNSKKSSGISNAPTIINPQTDKDISLNTNSIHTPNFHDFLNLPVKYSSSKFVYPLVSSSYANLKYQGNNKNFVSNHKNYSTTTTTSPKYYTVPTKFYTPDAAATKATSQFHVDVHSTVVTKTTNPPTRPPPPVTTVATTTSTTITTTPTTEATQATTTPKPLFTREPTKYTTTKYKYSTIRKRPLTTTTETLKESPSTTPVTTYSPTTITTAFVPTISTSPSPTTTNIIQRPTTIHAPFRPLPTLSTTTPSPTTGYSTRSPGDVYSSMSNKKDPNDMSLSELFNSLLDDELPENSNSQQYDTFSESSVEIETRKPILQNGSFVGVSEENIGNEYVKYEVQKPNINVAQYKPVSSMNNIVISPDQDSASFVLGSQQSVGSPYLASSGKETVASNPVVSDDLKYGTYYNENSYQSMKPQGFVMTRTTEKPTTIEVRPEPEPVKQSNPGIRFPVDKFENAPIVTGTFKNDFIAPMALPQTGTGHIVFPPNSETMQTTVKAQHLASSNSEFSDSTNLVSFQDNNDKTNQVPVDVGNSKQVISLHQVQKNQQQQHQQQQPQPQGPHTLQFTQQQEFIQPNQYESPLQQQFIQPQYQFNPQQQQHQPPPQFVQLQNSHTSFPLTQQQHQLQQQQHQQLANQQLTNEPNRQQTLQPNRHPEMSNIQGSYPTISNDLTPPEESNGHSQQQFSEINHRPASAPITRPPQHFVHNDLTRNPLPGVHRPVNNDRPLPNILPNILPQFRPNAKIGQGHPTNKDGANVRMGQSPFGARLPQQQQQQQQQRIQHNNQNGRPNPPFRRPPSSATFNSKMAGPPQPPTAEQMDQNRRYFQLRPSGNERIYNYPPRHYIDNLPAQRHGSIDIAEPKSDTQLPIYENNEFQRNIPRRSVGQQMPSERVTEERGKLEPVVTLQMIQYQKMLQKDANKQNPNTVLQNKNPDAPVSIHTASDKPPVYVVYPVKTSPMKLDVIGQKDADPVVVGQRGEQSPLPPSEINAIGAGNEYQNTPFTVIRQEQEPILMVKQKNPNQQANKQQFPYPLERPENGLEANGQIYFKKDPFYGNNGLYNLGEEPVDAQGKVVNRGTFNLNRHNEEKISSKLTRLTERPIAIAYTPTEPTHYYDNGDKFSIANHASSVIPEIRDEADETDEYGNPSRGENYQQDFQAPFYPSVSLGNSPDHRNGWSVLTSTQNLAKNKEINNRSDTNVENGDEKAENKDDEMIDGMDVNTESFNAESFQPEFQSGFKPIYPADVKESPAVTPKAVKAAKEVDSIEALVYDDEDDKEETSTNK